MKTIWKKQIGFVDRQLLYAPPGAEVLVFRNQHEMASVWFLCDAKLPEVAMGEIRIMGTGHELAEEGWRYIGTDLFHGGELVLHAFFRPIN